MPDIVSNIILKAMGADEAAREILKLEKAYKETGKAAQEISPEGVGKADPFASAVASGTFQAARETAGREARSETFRQRQRDREESNATYSSRNAPGMVQAGVGVAQQAGAGRYAGAVGGALSGIGAMLGPAGVGLIAAGGLFKAGQSLAEQAYGRVENLWGTGVSQRFGTSFDQMENFAIGLGRKGVPETALNQFLQTASRAGVEAKYANIGVAGGSNAVQKALDAVMGLGVDPGQAATMLGALSRSGAGNLAQYSMWSGMEEKFGRPNIGLYMQEFTRSVESAMTKGIVLSQEQIQRRQGMIGAYVTAGGLSVTGATALNQLMESRGVSAAGLQRPEDVIAYQLMKEKYTGLGMTDLMLKMEQNPNEVNQMMYQYIQESSGNQDIARMRFKGYAGTGTMGQTVGAMATLGDVDLGEIGKVPGISEGFPSWVEAMRPTQQIVGAKQAQLLFGAEKAALEAATLMKKVFSGGSVNINTLSVRLGGAGFNPDMAGYEEAKAELGAVGIKPMWEGLFPGLPKARTSGLLETQVSLRRGLPNLLEELGLTKAGARERMKAIIGIGGDIPLQVPGQFSEEIFAQQVAALNEMKDATIDLLTFLQEINAANVVYTDSDTEFGAARRY